MKESRESKWKLTWFIYWSIAVITIMAWEGVSDPSEIPFWQQLIYLEFIVVGIWLANIQHKEKDGR